MEGTAPPEYSSTSTEVEIFTPREYQIEAEQFAIQNQGLVIIHDGLGLGKTGEGYLIYKRLRWIKEAERVAGRVLVICGKNAQYTWRWQAAYWGCEPPVICEGGPIMRQAIWKHVREGQTLFVTITREALKRDLKNGWAPEQWWLIIVDECHKDLNRKTQNYNLQKQLKSRYRVFMSGSKRLLKPQNLWAPLNVLFPRLYGSYWRFVEKYCHIVRSEFGWEILGPKNAPQMAKELQSILLRRTKQDVLPQLPPKTRDFSHRLEMTTEQRRICDQLIKDSLSELTEGSYVVAPSVLTRILRMRQVLVCPKILDPGLGDGAAVDHLVEMLDETDDQHMVVFTPFYDAIDPVIRRLNSEGYYDTFSIFGGIQIRELELRIREFRRTRGIMFCTIAFAESFDLTPATWEYFLGPEWDPDMCEQAEDRLHRMNTTFPINVYYPIYRGGVDEELMLPALDAKEREANTVVRQVALLRQKLLKMREEM